MKLIHTPQINSSPLNPCDINLINTILKCTPVWDINKSYLHLNETLTLYSYTLSLSYTHIHTPTHTNTHTHKHTNTHTQTHTHTSPNPISNLPPTVSMPYLYEAESNVVLSHVFVARRVKG